MGVRGIPRVRVEVKGRWGRMVDGKSGRYRGLGMSG